MILAVSCSCKERKAIIFVNKSKAILCKVGIVTEVLMWDRDKLR